jgi:hypothetical protein
VFSRNLYFLSIYFFLSSAGAYSETLPEDRSFGSCLKIIGILPSTKIVLDEALLPILQSGLKTTTVRMGVRDGISHKENYNPGLGYFISTGTNTRVDVYIKRIAFMIFKDLGREELAGEGFDMNSMSVEDARADLFRGMKSKYYPDMTMESPVTVVHYAKVDAIDQLPEKVTRGLVIRGPHIDHILSGEKTWELRTTNTSVRETIALIRGGSGKIFGVADLVRTQGPLKNQDVVRAAREGRLPSAEVVFDEKYNWAWELENIRVLKEPREYKHPSGAVIWVKLAQRD